MNFAPLTSQLDVISWPVAVTETLPIRAASPYRAEMSQIPQVSETVGNVWLDLATAAGLITVTVDGDARTLINHASPDVGEVFLERSLDNAWQRSSTRLYFNAADAGKSAVVSYLGCGSPIRAAHIQALQAAITRLEAAPWLKLFSLNTYAEGYWDGRTADAGQAWLFASQMPLTGRTGATAWFPGLLLDFETGGNCAVAAFTNAGYWKRIVVLLDYDGADWIVATVESVEAATAGALVTPFYDATWLCPGYVDVQNGATLAAILPIAAAQLTSLTVFPSANVTYNRDFVYFGDLIAGEAIDAAFAFPANGVLLGLLVTMEDAGSSGLTTIDLRYHEAGDATGVTVFADPGDKPQIAGSGTAEDRYFISQAFLAAGPGDDPNAGFLTVASGQVYRFLLEDVAAGARNLRLTLTYRLFRG